MDSIFSTNCKPNQHCVEKLSFWLMCSETMLYKSFWRDIEIMWLYKLHLSNDSLNDMASSDPIKERHGDNIDIYAIWAPKEKRNYSDVKNKRAHAKKKAMTSEMKDLQIGKLNLQCKTNGMNLQISIVNFICMCYWSYKNPRIVP